MSPISKLALSALLLATTISAVCSVSAATTESNSNQMPFWRSNAMENEPLFFIQGGGGPGVVLADMTTLWTDVLRTNRIGSDHRLFPGSA